MTPRQSVLILAGIAAVFLVLIVLQDRLHIPGEFGIGSDELLATFVAYWSAEGLLWLGAVAIVVKWGARLPAGSTAAILAVAVMLRVVPLVAPTFLSTDVFRYVWDGRVQMAGINPYRYIPSAPELEALREPNIYPNINRADYAPTIYPPVAQMMFAAVAAVGQTTRTMKIAMVGFEAIACAVMLRILAIAALPTQRILIYAWNPLVIWEYAGNGHVDVFAILWIGLGVLAAASGRRILAGVALAGATLTKFLPLVIGPALWRREKSWRDLRLPIAFAVTVVAAYACYVSVGWKVFGFLGTYTTEEHLQQGNGIWWLRLAALAIPVPDWAGTAWFVLLASGLAVYALAILRPSSQGSTARRMTSQSLVFATATTAALTPHYVWYFGWLAYLACVAAWPSVLWLLASCVLLYLDPIHDRVGWESVMYLPFLALSLRDIVRAHDSGRVTVPRSQGDHHVDDAE